jgi:hypothetical protein
MGRHEKAWHGEERHGMEIKEIQGMERKGHGKVSQVLEMQSMAWHGKE